MVNLIGEHGISCNINSLNNRLQPEINTTNESMKAIMTNNNAIYQAQSLQNKLQPEEANNLDIEQVNKRNIGPVREVWNQVQGLLKMMADPKVARTDKSLALAAIVYLISPVDAIPDVIPFIGLTDDVAVILYVVKKLSDTISMYLNSQEQQNEININRQREIETAKLETQREIETAKLETQREIETAKLETQKERQKYILMTTFVVLSAFLVLAFLTTSALKV